MPALVAAMVAFALLGSTMRTAVNDSDALATAGTIFAGVFVQALPFLAVGVLLSALIAVFVRPGTEIPVWELVITSAHQATGAVLLGMSTMLALWARRLVAEEPSGQPVPA